MPTEKGQQILTNRLTKNFRKEMMATLMDTPVRVSQPASSSDGAGSVPSELPASQLPGVERVDIIGASGYKVEISTVATSREVPHPQAQ